MVRPGTSFDVESVFLVWFGFCFLFLFFVFVLFVCLCCVVCIFFFFLSSFLPSFILMRSPQAHATGCSETRGESR